MWTTASTPLTASSNAPGYVQYKASAERRSWPGRGVTHSFDILDNDEFELVKPLLLEAVDEVLSLLLRPHCAPHAETGLQELLGDIYKWRSANEVGTRQRSASNDCAHNRETYGRRGSHWDPRLRQSWKQEQRAS